MSKFAKPVLRFRVDMFNVKDFNEPYDEKVQYRLGNLEPIELTRMGTVVRHATYKLDEVEAAIKLLVILTDGRPYDLEYGNLEYAISDTKIAIQEARSKNSRCPQGTGCNGKGRKGGHAFP